MTAFDRGAVDEVLAAAQDRVLARAAKVLATPPDVQGGRWTRELAERIELAATEPDETVGLLRACAAIQQWEQNTTDFLEEIGVAVEIGFGDRDPTGLRRSAFTQSLDPERFGHGENRPEPGGTFSSFRVPPGSGDAQ